METKQKFPRKGTLGYGLASCDWSDLTSRQIAEVLDVTVAEVVSAVSDLKARYGITVDYKKAGNALENRKAPERAGTGQVRIRRGTNQWRVYELREEMPSMTTQEIAERLDITESQVSGALGDLRRKGIYLDYKRRKPWEGSKKKMTEVGNE